MLIVVGGIKGGSGKTTLATNLSVLRAEANKKILLVDADEQKSASDWAEQRNFSENALHLFSTISISGKTLHANLIRMKQDYDDIIIDVGGRDTTSQRSALSVADIFIIPFKPTSLDIWTIGSVKNMIMEIKAANPKLRCYPVLNQADIRGQDNENASEILKECDQFEFHHIVIKQRKSYSNAAADGLSVCEMKIKDQKAISEIRNLYTIIYSD